MISRAEQQFVIKMSPGKELDALVARDLCGYKKIKSKLMFTPESGVIRNAVWQSVWVDGTGKTSGAIPQFSTDLNLAMDLLEALGEPTKIIRAKDTDSWEIAIGAAKKVITINTQNLATGLCKAMVLFVRKFGV